MILIKFIYKTNFPYTWLLKNPGKEVANQAKASKVKNIYIYLKINVNFKMKRNQI